MSEPLHYWRIRCTTEGAWVYEWAEDEPTTCPNNAAHTIVTGSIASIDRRDWQRVLLDPVMEPVIPGSSKVVANDRPAIEVQDDVTGWAAAQGKWPLEQSSTAQLCVTLSVILKEAGTGTKVRIAARAKAEGDGEDSSEVFTAEEFTVLTVSAALADIGKVYSGCVMLDASTFHLDDALALQFGRDGGSEISGTGDDDDVDVAVQIIAVKMEGRE